MRKMYIIKCKEKFTKNEILWLVFQGALSRGYPYLVYKPGVTPEDKTAFKKYLGERLDAYSALVNSNLNDDKYVKILEEFQDIVNSKYKKILNYDGLTFGRVQKLLNLYLKYLWVFNKLEQLQKPIHCPIDSIILGEIDWPYPNISWTMPEFTAQKYKEAIGLCRIKAKERGFGNNISAWELCIFNDR